MSMDTDRKRAHEDAARTAIHTRNYSDAFHHTLAAAQIGIMLARKAEKGVAKKFVEDAAELMDIADQLKSRMEKSVEKRNANSVAVPPLEISQTQTQTDGWAMTRRPSVRFRDIAGLDDVKEEILEAVIYPFQHAKTYERFRLDAGGGVLMYGPPGNGKTLIAKAVAGELDAAFIHVELSRIKSKYVGETAKNLAAVFKEASSYPKTVLFIDEAEALLSRRGNQKIDSVAEFLALADGVEVKDNCILLLLATNKPWLLDEAVIRPGRVGTHLYVGPPDFKARQGILDIHLSGVPVADSVDLGEMARLTEGYSGADISAVCRLACRRAARREISTGESQLVSGEDLHNGVEQVRPSNSKQTIDAFREWRETGKSPIGLQPQDFD